MRPDIFTLNVFRTNDIKNTCCWLWLINNDTGTEEARTMEALEVEKNAKDIGPESKVRRGRGGGEKER